MLVVECSPCDQDELDALAILTRRARDAQGNPLVARPWKEFRIADENWDTCLELGRRAGWVPRGVFDTRKDGKTPGFELSTLYRSIGWGYEGCPSILLADDAAAWADALERVLVQPAMWPAAGQTAWEDQFNPPNQATVVDVDAWRRLRLTTTKIKALIDWLRQGAFSFAMDD